MKSVRHERGAVEWGLDAFEKINKAISKIINKQLRPALLEAMHYSLTSRETYLYFPVIHEELGGAKRVRDPLTMHLHVDFGDYKDRYYEFNLRDEAFLVAPLKDTERDGSWHNGFGRLSHALRALADEIDEARVKYTAKSFGSGGCGGEEQTKEG